MRNAVFAIIARHLDGVRIDSLIVEKRKTGPALQPVEHFYPRMLGHLLRHVLDGFNLADFQEVIVFTDRVPVNKHRKAVEKAVKINLAEVLPSGTRFRVYHHEST